jgi:hypothetical protein
MFTKFLAMLSQGRRKARIMRPITPSAATLIAQIAMNHPSLLIRPFISDTRPIQLCP